MTRCCNQRPSLCQVRFLEEFGREEGCRTKLWVRSKGRHGRWWSLRESEVRGRLTLREGRSPRPPGYATASTVQPSITEPWRTAIALPVPDAGLVHAQPLGDLLLEQAEVKPPLAKVVPDGPYLLRVSVGRRPFRLWDDLAKRQRNPGVAVIAPATRVPWRRKSYNHRFDKQSRICGPRLHVVATSIQGIQCADEREPRRLAPVAKRRFDAGLRPTSSRAQGLQPCPEALRRQSFT